MEQIQLVTNFQIGGNTVAEWVIAIGVFLAIFIALQMVRTLLVKRIHAMAQKTSFKIDDVISGFFHSMKTPVFVLIALFIAVRGVNVPESLDLILNIALVVVIVAQVVRLLEEVLVMLLERQFRKKDTEAELPGVFRIATRMLLWSVGFLLILSNIGIDITSLVAGMGIGGLAISLALQNILSDLFSSFSIAVDKPFTIGDFIIIGDHQGTVKHIGLKTTRITALEGEEIVISNAELTSARVQNYRKMQKRRVVMQIGVTYDTSHENLKKMNDIMKNAVSAQEQAQFDRSHFFEFGDSNLIFEVVYFIKTRDYAIYMDVQQAINFAIVDAFESNGIEMAYPTQTLYLKKEDA